MEMLSIVCIPINIAIIYFTGDGSYTKDGNSAMVKYVGETFNEPLDSIKMVAAAVIIEHLILGIKVVVAALIRDTPQVVLKNEHKRVYVQRKAR